MVSLVLNLCFFHIHQWLTLGCLFYSLQNRGGVLSRPTGAYLSPYLLLKGNPWHIVLSYRYCGPLLYLNTVCLSVSNHIFMSVWGHRLFLVHLYWETMLWQLAELVDDALAHIKLLEHTTNWSSRQYQRTHRLTLILGYKYIVQLNAKNCERFLELQMYRTQFLVHFPPRAK